MLSTLKLFSLLAGLLVLMLLSQLVYAHGMSEAEKLSIAEGGFSSPVFAISSNTLLRLPWATVQH